MSYAVKAEELERLLRLEHHDPHSILGAHPQDGGVVVRALRPDATSVLLLIDGEEPRPMARNGTAGLFEIFVTDRRGGFHYSYEVHHPSGAVTRLRDPYSFLPTLGEVDLHLFNEGNHLELYEKLGAHVREIEGATGVAFAVWAPNALGVSVVGDFNGWDGRFHPMRSLGSSGVWELFVPGLEPGARYKYEIHDRGGALALKTDPFAAAMEAPPATASVVYESRYAFGDGQWMARRTARDHVRNPLSIYEVHLGSWRRSPEQGGRPLTYRELATVLADYVCEMGFTHVELLPVMEHPFVGSWGYQVSGYFAPTARYGHPDDFRFFVDHLHQRGIGVLLDWVPGHFPTDDFTLGRFDGTALYEHLDLRQGFHPDWGTYVFNYGRPEVRNFLVASALDWLGGFHADGLRVDAVASMLYLDYARSPGEWIPNIYGGKENLEAIAFLRALNELCYARRPGVIMTAEESTAWPAVSRPTYVGGLGFGFKWDMGWMHDTLEYFAKDPVHRRYHHRNLSFGLLYAWSENFILPLSHDEAVHGKRSLLSKMPGDVWQQFANLRALYGYMWARPGKKLLFMGGEFGQWREWDHDSSLDWHLLGQVEHRGVQALVRDLNRIYAGEPALFEGDAEPVGFQWIDADDADDNAIAFMRIAPTSGRRLVCVCNFSPVVRHGFRVGVPQPGLYREILNTDSELYGGSNLGNGGAVWAEPAPRHGFAHSLNLVLPPLGVLWFMAPDA